MYDSENIPLATRIQAGDGVTISHATNSDGEAIWTAQVDQTWLTSWVNANSAGALKLNDSDEARIRALETKLGIEPAETPTPPAVTSGEAGTTEITVSADVATMTAQSTFDYGLVGVDGTEVISATMIASNAATPTQILMALYSQMKRNNGMLSFMTPTYDFDNDKLILTWKEGNVGSSFTYSIVSQGTGDNLAFTVTDY